MIHMDYRTPVTRRFYNVSLPGIVIKGRGMYDFKEGRYYTRLKVTYAKAFRILEERGLMTSVPARRPLNPLPYNYNPNYYCHYHSGETGHQTKNCKPLRHRIQHFIDSGIVSISYESIPTPEEDGTAGSPESASPPGDTELKEVLPSAEEFYTSLIQLSLQGTEDDFPPSTTIKYVPYNREASRYFPDINMVAAAKPPRMQNDDRSGHKGCYPQHSFKMRPGRLFYVLRRMGLISSVPAREKPHPLPHDFNLRRYCHYHSKERGHAIKSCLFAGPFGILSTKG